MFMCSTSRTMGRGGGVGFGESLRWALEDDPAAVRARARAELDEPVAGGEEGRIVLDDEHGVAGGNERVECADEHRDVGGLEADGGFVQHVQGGCLRRAGELLGELEPLRFAARQAPARLADDEVAEPERDGGPADPAHRVEVAPLVDEFGDGEGLDVGEASAPLDAGRRSRGDSRMPPHASQVWGTDGRNDMSSCHAPLPLQASQR